MKQSQKPSMKWKVIRILLLCWLIPLVFLLGVMGLYVGTNHSGMSLWGRRLWFINHNRTKI